MIRKSDPQTIAPYLKDASNFSGGCAEEVIIPETTAELVEFLQNNDRPVTVAGAGTGLRSGKAVRGESPRAFHPDQPVD